MIVEDDAVATGGVGIRAGKGEGADARCAWGEGTDEGANICEEGPDELTVVAGAGRTNCC